MARVALYVLGAALAYFLGRVIYMKVKAGVSLEGVSWRMFWAAIVVDEVMQEHGTEAVITSGVDGEHMANSLHYRGNALDFRTHQVRNSIATVASKIRSRLGPNYDVVIESTHLHVEYDPPTV